ncbi:hypothetical protein EC844_11549 [Acinetobacter calcoaceticus]|uniref:Uncharacterized protein n=1 Tax=Acinetobacter calcoaceticus TaxID=471 RepID=A0A4R1XQ96_ACICA|nr:hypothetical protein EC844_11549 [Acinetobacter calcoaceticus]
MVFTYLLGAMIVILLIAFYALVLSKSDEIPAAEDISTASDLTQHSLGTESISPRQTHPSSTATDQSRHSSNMDSASPVEARPEEPRPEQQTEYSLWEYFVKAIKGTAKFIFEVLFEIIILGILKFIWFLIRGFFMLLGRIFD